MSRETGMNDKDTETTSKVDHNKISQQASTHQMIFKYFLVIFLIAIFLFGKLMWPFFSILVLGFVLTAIFYPAYRFFAKKMPRAVASAITCTIIFLVVFVPLVLLIGALSGEAYNLYLTGTGSSIGRDIKEIFQKSRIIETIQQFLAGYNIKLDADHINSWLSALGKSVGLFLYQQLSVIASNVLKFMVNFALMLLVIFFLLIDGTKLIDFFIELSPLPNEQDRKLINKFHEMASVVIVVNGISGVVQGFLGGIVFWIVGLNSPLLWGTIMAILAFFPIVGIGIVLIPASFYLFLKGRIGAAIFCFVFYVTVSSVIEYFVKPKLVGNKVRIHTLLVFLSILGGMKLFGILGIIYGPLVITALLTLIDIYRSSYETYMQ